MTQATRPGTGAAGVAALAARALPRVAHGALAGLPLGVRFWDGSELHRAGGGELATLYFNKPTALAQLARHPDQLGLARAWTNGTMEVQGDLAGVLGLRHRLAGVRLRARDRALLALAALRAAGLEVLMAPPRPAVEARRRGRRHSLARDRDVVRHHYDVSNRFYELLLGPGLVYSCARFHSDSETLEQAQSRKLELICRKLRLAPGERLLDIGCGWGSLLLHAAAHHGVRGVGATLSGQQAELARRRVREAGLSDQIEIRLLDYRRVGDGPYDKIASVGMYEHLGRANYGVYARIVHSLLRPGGLFFNDGIARLFSTPPRRATFIDSYVFPDGELHPLTALLDPLERAGLELRQVESLREDYARTLRGWLGNLQANRAEAEREIGHERMRVWELYLVASAVGFDDADITNYHLVAERSG